MERNLASRDLWRFLAFFRTLYGISGKLYGIVYRFAKN